MANECMTLKELSAYLKRPADELERMALRDKIPARRASGEWRFERAEIHHWLETRLHTLSVSELAALDGSPSEQDSTQVDELLLTPLLSEKTTAVPLQAKTRPSVLRSLVELAEKSGEVYLPGVILDAIVSRENLLSTALDCGVALPHWRRPLAKTLSSSMIAYGRTTSGIPFGAPGGGLTDIFFLALCRDDRTHLQVLARLARLFKSSDFLGQLRAADSTATTLQIIETAERELVDPSLRKRRTRRALQETSTG
jgi:PTS system nitrogen regulatory IIA component